MLRLRSENTVEENIAYLCGSLTVEERAGTKSEEVFLSLYEVGLTVFSVTFCDRKKYLTMEYGKNPYGDMSPAQAFEYMYNENLNAIKKFPREILSEVADIRLLALGYGGAAVKKALERYITYGA